MRRLRTAWSINSEFLNLYAAVLILMILKYIERVKHEQFHFSFQFLHDWFHNIHVCMVLAHGCKLASKLFIHVETVFRIAGNKILQQNLMDVSCYKCPNQLVTRTFSLALTRMQMLESYPMLRNFQWTAPCSKMLEKLPSKSCHPALQQS